jgi:hypothetical protein
VCVLQDVYGGRLVDRSDHGHFRRVRLEHGEQGDSEGNQGQRNGGIHQGKIAACLRVPLSVIGGCRLAGVTTAQMAGVRCGQTSDADH